MFPLNAIPVSGNTKFQTFYASGTDWQAWQKPAGCSMVYIFALGGGGGGGRPANGAITVGGGGGGSGSIVRALIPATLLPDTLYVRSGIGGAGSTVANSAGADGLSSYVAVYPTADASATVRTSYYILFGAGGGGGQASTTGGAAGGVTLATSNAFSALGLWYAIAGQAGAAGANALNGGGNAIIYGASGLITSGGSGGSNGSANGVGINATGLFPTIPNGSPSNSGTKASTGFQKGLPILQGLKTAPLFFSGGASGGGGTTGTAGSGGDASYGGGGGGGGGCSGAGTSGSGGNGGDGFIIIGTF